MIRVGVIGLGMMGSTHLDVYAKNPDVQIVAISDVDPERLHGRSKAQGNIEGQAQGGIDLSSVRKYDEGKKLIRDKNVDLVDICLITPMHLEYAKLALKAGKHVLVEKPLARTSKDAYKLASIADKAGTLSMCAMCMRFWPGWSWLKQVVDQKTYGNVLSAEFHRRGGMPGGNFYKNGQLSGGASLDLHIHDTDFIQYCFGMPRAVTSHGLAKTSGAIDHISTVFHYDDIPLVTAMGHWFNEPSVGFEMKYTVCFEQATAIFDLASPKPVTLYQKGQTPQPLDLPAAMGYQLEIEYFIDCIRKNRKPEIVTLESAARSVQLVEAEVKSATTGKTVKLAKAAAAVA